MTVAVAGTGSDDFSDLCTVFEFLLRDLRGLIHSRGGVINLSEWIKFVDRRLPIFSDLEGHLLDTRL